MPFRRETTSPSDRLDVRELQQHQTENDDLLGSDFGGEKEDAEDSRVHLSIASRNVSYFIRDASDVINAFIPVVTLVDRVIESGFLNRFKNTSRRDAAIHSAISAAEQANAPQELADVPHNQIRAPMQRNLLAHERFRPKTPSELPTRRRTYHSPK